MEETYDLYELKKQVREELKQEQNLRSNTRMEHLASFSEIFDFYRDQGLSDADAREVALAYPRAKRQKFFLLKTQGKCMLCGSTEYLTVDHIKPISKGGKKQNVRNKQLLCRKCNWDKDNPPLRDYSRLKYIET